MAKGKFGKLRSVELSDDEKIDALKVPALSESGVPDYPYGLRISLDQRTCEKLGLDPHDCKKGDLLDMRCMAKIDHVSINKGDKETCCVELQITHIAAEDESNEQPDGDDDDD